MLCKLMEQHRGLGHRDLPGTWCGSGREPLFGCGEAFAPEVPNRLSVLYRCICTCYRIAPQSDRGFSQDFSHKPPQSDRELRPKVIVENCLNPQTFVHSQASQETASEGLAALGAC